MLARGLLFTLAIVSLIWIGYSSLNIVDRDKEFDPKFLFNSNDIEVLIINNSSEQNGVHSIIQLNEPTQKIVQTICDQSINIRIFASKNNGKILLQSNQYFNSELLKSIFGSNNELSFKSDKSFTYGKWNGEIYKNSALLFLDECQRNEDVVDFKFDKNAVGAIISFLDEKVKVSDIYIKNNNILEYATLSDSPITASKISDEKIFAPVISTSIQSYTFFEVDYLRNVDSVFLKSIANNWVKSGIVIVNINGKQAIVTDYILGQNPIQIFNDHYQLDNQDSEIASFEGLPLTQFFKSSESIFLQEFNDYVVIANDKAVCDKIVGDYKLGNTIAQAPSLSNQIYGNMPKKINYRHSDNVKKETKTITNNVILSSISNSTTKTFQKTKKSQDLTLNIGEAIVNFYPLNGRNIFVQTASDKILFFDNGSKKWEMQFENLDPTGELIDLFANDKKQLLVRSSKKLHLITVLGEEVNGFPFTSDELLSENPTYYRWKGSGTFLLPSGSNIIQVDTKGREINVIKGQVGEIQSAPIVWTSAGKLFLGINGSESFEMINLEQGKSYRKFSNNGCSYIAKIPNEIFLYGFDGNQLKKVDQKGTLTKLGSFENGKIVEIYQQGQNPTILIRQNNLIKLINEKGLEWSSIRIPFNEIEALKIQEINDKLLISLIDGLENNSYIYSTDGQKWNKEDLKGKLKIEVIQENNGIDFISVIDQMIVYKTL